MNKEKVFNFIKEHKWELIGGILLTSVGAAVGINIYKKHRKAVNYEGLYEVLRMASKEQVPDVVKIANKVIDEQIFTDLAPAIEKLVCNDSVEHAVVERAYELGHDGLSKFVKVTIDQYAGD